jgi:hypothetical protein
MFFVFTYTGNTPEYPATPASPSTPVPGIRSDSRVADYVPGLRFMPSEAWLQIVKVLHIYICDYISEYICSYKRLNNCTYI